MFILKKRLIFMSCSILRRFLRKKSSSNWPSWSRFPGKLGIGGSFRTLLIQIRRFTFLTFLNWVPRFPSLFRLFLIKTIKAFGMLLTKFPFSSRKCQSTRISLIFISRRFKLRIKRGEPISNRMSLRNQSSLKLSRSRVILICLFWSWITKERISCFRLNNK